MTPALSPPAAHEGWHDEPAGAPGIVYDASGRVVLLAAMAGFSADERRRIARLASRAPALRDLVERAYTSAAVDAAEARGAADLGDQSDFDAPGAELWADMLRLELACSCGDVPAVPPARDVAPAPASSDPFYPGPYRIESVMGRATIYATDGTPLAVGYVIPHHEAEALATFRLWAASFRLLAEARRVLLYLESLSLSHQPPVMALASAVKEAAR